MEAIFTLNVCLVILLCMARQWLYAELYGDICDIDALLGPFSDES